MSDGQRIVLAGAGDQEVSDCVHYLRVWPGFTRLLQPGLPPGDVIFVLKTQRHESFERSGSDLLSTVSVTLSEALLGFDRILINHLDGRGVRVASPKAKVLTSGMTIVLRNEGMPTYKNPDARGNLYIVLKVEMPNEDWIGTVDQKVPILHSSLVYFLCLTLVYRRFPHCYRPRRRTLNRCQKLWMR